MFRRNKVSQQADEFFDIAALISSMPECVYWKDLQGIYRGCNEFLLDLAGVKTQEEIIGKNDFDIGRLLGWGAEVANRIKIIDQEVLSSGVPKLNIEEPPLLMANGKTVYLNTSKVPLKNQSGEIFGLLGISVDITMLKQSLERERLAALRISQVMSYLPAHLYWKDKDGVYLGCNLQQAQSLGFKSIEEVIGKTDFDITESKKEAEAFREHDLDVMETRKVRTMEEVAVFAGEKIIVLSQKAPLYDEKREVIGVIGTSVDITELKKAQEQEKNMAVKIVEERAQAEIAIEKELRQAVMILAGSIAHDLRSPISMINMQGGSLQRGLDYLLNMYRKSGDDKFSESQLKDLETTGEGLKKITKEMFDYIDVTLKTLSRGLKGGITQEDLVECSMWHCVHNTLLRYPFTDEQRKLVIWDQQDFKFMGNELLVIRVFSNLITNALQQVEKNKKGQIAITTEINPAGNIIRFRDTAGGASAEIVNHLFDGYKTTKEKGTGIGLAFCKMTMEGFGGSISCHSVEGDYIEFVLTFPQSKTH